jgi:hypothetical protein
MTDKAPASSAIGETVLVVEDLRIDVPRSGHDRIRWLLASRPVKKG